MAFTPEDGTGIATANSFIDLDAADAYHSDRGVAAWAALTGVTNVTITVANVDAAANTFTSAAHGYASGRRCEVEPLVADPDSNITALAGYVYLVVVDANTLKFATSYANAVAATPTTINFADPAAPTHQKLIFETEKEGALVRATSYLDLVYGDAWIGEKADDANPLSWPRVNAYLWPRGDSVPSSTALDVQVPAAIQRACAEIALRLAAGTDLLPDSSAGVVSSQSITLPGMSRSVVYAEPGALPNMPIVDRLLAPYVRAPEVYRR